MPNPIYVLGRFPPPVDGQAVATRQLAELLDGEFAVERVDLAPDGEIGSGASVSFDWRRTLRYWRRGRTLPDRLATHPSAPVLWTSISPSFLGHWRDRATVLPALCGSRPVIAVVHWGNFDRLFRSPLTRWSARRATDRLDGFVLLGEHLSEKLAPWIPKDRRYVIPNTLDEAVRCSPEEIETKLAGRPNSPHGAVAGHRDREAIRILFLSNMTPSKGYLDVLEAARGLRDRERAVRVDFVGGWESEEDRREFEDRVGAAELRDRVTHHGAIRSRGRIRELHLSADLFVLPTYYPVEAQPLTVIEALNAATPVIVTEQGGLSEMIEDGRSGIFVPPRAPERIAEAVERIARPGRWTEFARAARARYEEAFHPGVVRRRWSSVIRRVSKKG